MNFRKMLLVGGIVGPMMYLIHDVIGAYRSPNFSFIENTVSDLTNAAVRGDYLLGVILLFIASLMGTAFGVGIVVNFSRSDHKKLAYAGIATAITGFIQLFSATVFPQDPIGTEATLSGILHLVIVAISAVLAIAQLVLVRQWAFKRMKWKVFATLTLTTLFLMLAGGVLTGVIASKQWALLGAIERVAVYPYQLWTAILAYRLVGITVRAS